MMNEPLLHIRHDLMDYLPFGLEDSLIPSFRPTTVGLLTFKKWVGFGWIKTLYQIFVFTAVSVFLFVFIQGCLSGRPGVIAASVLLGPIILINVLVFVRIYAEMILSVLLTPHLIAQSNNRRQDNRAVMPNPDELSAARQPEVT